MKSEFLHVGITVKSLEKTIDFYKKYFGFELENSFTFPAAFFENNRVLYNLEDGISAPAAFLKSPDGVVLELFEFSKQLPFQAAEWNRPGYHHLCFKVENVPEKYQEMKADGVEFYFEPGFRGDPKNGEYWVFLKDPDGNMIELQ
jgi:catechol 2,3-dioxygenase-like lactoylglutathione lyase family enzyme